MTFRKIVSLTCGIVIYDEVNEIQVLIPKLKQELKDFDVEWVFVLNHEQSEIRKWIKTWLHEQITNIKCIENPANNLGLARQLILENAENDYVYLTDPDIDLKSNSLVQLITLASSTYDSKLKMIGYGGAVLHMSENRFLQNTFTMLTKISQFFPFAFQFQNHQALRTVDHLPACHILLNKEAALKIGGFSSQFFKCGEDLDFTHRAYNQQYRFLFLPSSQVIHWQNLSLSRWIQKIFAFGRVQIFAQKLNYKKGIRLYRLLPVLFLLCFIGISIYHLMFFFSSLLLILAFILIEPAFLGFFLTILTYSLGEFFEIIWPLFECKNEAELLELKKRLNLPFAATKKSI